jgi:hypothetical protein
LYLSFIVLLNYFNYEKPREKSMAAVEVLNEVSKLVLLAQGSGWSETAKLVQSLQYLPVLQLHQQPSTFSSQTGGLSPQLGQHDSSYHGIHVLQ